MGGSNLDHVGIDAGHRDAGENRTSDTAHRVVQHHDRVGNHVDAENIPRPLPGDGTRRGARRRPGGDIRARTDVGIRYPRKGDGRGDDPNTGAAANRDRTGRDREYG